MRIRHPFGIVEERTCIEMRMRQEAFLRKLNGLPLGGIEHPQGPPVAEDQDIDPDVLEEIEIEVEEQQ